MKTGTLLIAFALLLACLGAKGQDAQDSFLPGATVTLAVQVQPPADWTLNPKVPLRVSFDQSLLKQHLFKVDRASWDFTLPAGKQTYTAEVPIKVSASLPAGTLSVPLHVACSICTSDESRCGFVNDDVQLKLHIKPQAADSDSPAPAQKGRLLAQHTLSPPE